MTSFFAGSGWAVACGRLFFAPATHASPRGPLPGWSEGSGWHLRSCSKAALFSVPTRTARDLYRPPPVKGTNGRGSQGARGSLGVCYLWLAVGTNAAHSAAN